MDDPQVDNSVANIAEVITLYFIQHDSTGNCFAVFIPFELDANDCGMFDAL